MKKIEEQIRKYCLSFPDTHEDHPWEHSAFKVNKKTFLFMGKDSSGMGLSMKLTKSHKSALKLPYAEPTGYGLGKHGWVSLGFGPKDKIPFTTIKIWIEESFRAIAPKTLLKQISENEMGRKKASNLELSVLEKMRLVCLDLPETSEFTAWGHPNFKAGSKTFAVLETYKGILSIAMKVGHDKRRSLLEDPHFYDTPYVGKQGWVSMKVDTHTLKNWNTVRDLLEESYRNSATEKMLKQL